MSWDGKINRVEESGVAADETTQLIPSALISRGAWDALRRELNRDSDLRLLVVVVRVSVVGVPRKRLKIYYILV